jgi:methylase of polypeptide subunit release factors
VTVGSGPIALEHVTAIERLRAALAGIGYTGDAIRGLLGEDAYQGRRWEVPVHLLRLRTGTPLELVVKLFFLGLPVSRHELDGALEPAVTVDELQQLGLLEAGESPLLATVRLVPHAELLLAGNRYPDEDPEGTPADYVATVTAPSAILASLTVREPVRRTLDIGTGSGVQALWAARHSDHVVAVDVNPRALNLAEFNARLNGIANIEFREGSFFGPVADERFDLIVCNAPYVVSPDTRYVYRDGGLASDALCEQLVRESATHLEEGAFAHLLISWVLVEEDWSARPRSWIEGKGCDCWLLLGAQRDPVTHAALWNEELNRDPSRFAETLDRWVDYLNALGADAVLEGAAIIRRRPRGRNWFRADRIPPGRPSPAAEHVRRVFRSQSYLSELADDETMLDDTLCLVEQVQVEQELRCQSGGYVVESMTMVLDEGLGFRAAMDQRTATLVPLLDGTRPLRESIEAAARVQALRDDDLDAFTRGALAVVREMLELGFVVRADGPTAAPSRR